MRRDEHVGPLADSEDLQELQGILVEALGGAIMDVDLDLHVRPFGLERRVQPVGGLYYIAGAQRSGRILPRPQLKLDRLSQRGRARECRGEQHCSSN